MFRNSFYFSDWPCLTFDIARDGLGDNRTTYPMECYIVSGTQAEKAGQNELLIMGLKNLTELNGVCLFLLFCIKPLVIRKRVTTTKNLMTMKKMRINQRNLLCIL